MVTGNSAGTDYILMCLREKDLTIMEGAVRFFAGEFCQSTLSVPGEDAKSPAWVVTPSGAYCRQVFIAGALTEVHEDGDMVYARLADPTGGFDLVCGGRTTPVAAMLQKIPQPSFISVSGRVQMYRKGNDVARSVRPEHIRLIDRGARDQWVLVTAEATLRRLAIARLALRGECTDERVAVAVRHYMMTPERLLDLAAMVEGAVMNVKPRETVPAEGPDVRALILDLLKAQGGPRGMAVQEIIDTLAANGVFQDVILTTIEALIVDDECYQPQKGFIRLL
jgi:uncharacterized protein